MESTSLAQREKKNRGSDYEKCTLWEAHLNACCLIIISFSRGVEGIKSWLFSLYDGST